MKAVTAGCVVILFFQVWVTPRMTMMSLLHCDHLSAVELDIDLA
jgi:hypothetical protein